MKKFITAALAVVVAFAANAQLVEPLSTQRVNLAEGTACEQATLSPDGSFAVVGAMGSSTLWRVDIASGTTKVLTNSGLTSSVMISPDGGHVVFNSVTYSDRRLRMTSLRSLDLTSGSEIELVKPSRHLNAGFALSNVGVTAVENGKARVRAFGSAKAQSMPVASINYGHLDITVNGKTTTLDPQGRGSYLWPSVSPDGTKVVYCLSGAGTFVCNIDGTNVRSLGYLHAARWMGNDMVVGMADYDNGEQILSSTVILSDLNGTRQALTNDSQIAIFPTASADGKHIAYTTLAGELFIINLK
ncbi:MAG: TolB family protein [Muribaculaceae bacterium]